MTLVERSIAAYSMCDYIIIMVYNVKAFAPFAAALSKFSK